jgi:GT2 family glycosyltransferase
VSTTGQVLSIVIVSFNCVEEIERCLESIARFPPGCPYEVAVIDNASMDGTVERLRSRFETVRVIALAENVGYGAAVNRAVPATSGSHLLFLNPDTEVTDGALDALLGMARRRQPLGVVGPRLVLGGGQPQPSARRFPSPWRLWLEVSRLHLLLSPRRRGQILAGTYFAQDRTGPVDWISGACHLVPRAVWDRIGGLTERTFCGFDDLDYCWRARQAGLPTWFCAEATVRHHCGVTVSRRWSPEEVDALAINNGYVVMSGHLPPWKVRLYGVAELFGTMSEWVLASRRAEGGGEGARAYRRRAGVRAALVLALLSGRARPIERCEPGRTAAAGLLVAPGPATP